MPQQGEASVEEILESIKKVISRDNRASALEQRRRRASEGMVMREVPAPGAEVAPEAEPADEDEASEVLDLSSMDFAEHASDLDGDSGSVDHFEDDDDEELLAEPGSDEGYVDEGDEHDDDVPLTTAAVRGAMRDNLAALAMLAEPGVPPQIVRSGETSLEGLTRDLLRPMLSEWLDKNLPGMVEKLVRAEIARIAGKRG